MSNIDIQVSDGVMHLVLQRPERKNALTSHMYEDLAAALDRAQADTAVHVVLLYGAQGVFTAGNDLDDFVENKPTSPDASVFRFMRSIAAFNKPVIAAVQGLAIGIGTTMLLHCDLVYVAQNTKFSLPFVNLGLVPEAASSLLLPRLAGHQRAMEKLLFGDVFTADDALALGFVNRVLPADEVLPFAQQQAQRLATLPAGSVRGTKSLAKGRVGQGSNDAVTRINEEATLFIQRVGGPATLEAIAAFKAKRKPDFSGKD